MNDSEREKALQTHIREKLLDYALTHLTKNYITYTENTVTELLSRCLFQIPTEDPTSLTLPVDPFFILFQSFGLTTVEPYDQKWVTEPEIKRYTCRLLCLSISNPKTERCFVEEDPCKHTLMSYAIQPFERIVPRCLEADCNYDFYRRMSPVLTTRATLQTPKIGGHKAVLDMISTRLADSLGAERIQAIEVEALEEPPTPDFANLLDLRMPIPTETREPAVALLRSVTSCANPTYVNASIDAFLGSSSPSPLCVHSEWSFLPIFSRDRLLGHADPINNNLAPAGLATLPDFASLEPTAKLENEDDDLATEHMRAVDGWQTYISSPMTPSPVQSNSEDQVDQLFTLSSPNTEPTPIQTLMDVMMDEVEIPRFNKLGSSTGTFQVLGGGKSLGPFLLPLIPASFIPLRKPNVNLQPSSPQSFSMIGQAPSIADNSGGLTDIDVDLEDFDSAISKTFECLREQDPKDVIMLEKLDDGDGRAMDVPILPPPNIHSPIQMYLPTNSRLLVATPKRGNSLQGPTTDDYHGFLTKAKGIKSLNLELSWIPFKAGLKTLTNEKLAEVSNFVGTPGEINIDAMQVQKLLELTTGIEPHKDSGIDFTRSYNSWLSFEDRNFNQKDFTCGENGSEMILTGEERRRLSGICVAEHCEPCSDRPHHESGSIVPEEEGADDSDKENDLIPVVCPDLAHSESDRKAGETRHMVDAEENSPEINDSGVSFPNTRFGLPQRKNDHFGANSSASFFNTDEVITGPITHSDSTLESYYQSPTEIARFPVGDRELWATGALFETDEPNFGHCQDNPEDGLRSGGTYSMPSQKPPVFSIGSPQRLHDPQGARTTDASMETDPVEYSFRPQNLDRRSSETTSREALAPLMSPRLGQAIPESQPTTLRSLGAAEFARLRGWQVQEHTPDIPQNPVEIQPPHRVPEVVEHTVPKDLVDRNTLILPHPVVLPSSVHRYLTSIDVIQKQALVRSLRKPQCSVELVEFDTLGGVDLVLDPHCAVVFVSLVALPSQCDALVDRISQQSWRYSQLLLVFEAYSVSLSFQPDREISAGTRIYCYTPPIVKAIKKLRRNLGVAEACDTKNSACNIFMAFANTVDEAGLFTRYFGNLAEASDVTSGAIWGNREWLEATLDDENEGDLACLEGMNTFAAHVILCQRTLQDFLDMTPAIRIGEFGPLIGSDRMELVNRVLDERLGLMESMESDILTEVD